MRITSIEPIPRRPGWRRVFADGVLLATASDETVLRLGLRTGDELTGPLLRTLEELQSRQHARQTALRFLAHRPRTRREIRDRLREEECEEALITETLDELERNGLINDRAFADAFIRDQNLRRAAGARLLRQKLLLLGVEREIVEEALAAAAAPEAELDAATELAAKLVKKTPLPRTPAERQKLRLKVSSALARRGFGWDTIGDAVRRALAERTGDADEGE
jgi:regulatory protein